MGSWWIIYPSSILPLYMHELILFGVMGHMFILYFTADSVLHKTQIVEIYSFVHDYDMVA